MFRLYLQLIVLLFNFSVATAGMVVGSGSVGGAWYYGTGESDNYGVEPGGYSSSIRCGDIWTPGVNKSVTKIGFKSGDARSTTCTLNLWENVTGTWTRRACGTINPIVDGWNDIDISAFSLTSSMEISITVICESGFYPLIVSSGSTGGVSNDGVTQANECSTNTFTVNDDWQHGSRFWGE